MIASVFSRLSGFYLKRYANEPHSCSDIQVDPTPISFSKSAASDKSRRLDPLLGDHDQQSNTLPMIMVAVGFLLCGTLLYSFVTAEKMTKEENEEKTIKAMEDLGTLIESAARDPKAARTET
eukprot:m.552588 g.552588  ORF g.552588 m.552588 type:complete len:122 (+) comp22167_c0_seq3:603-968(+)